MSNLATPTAPVQETASSKAEVMTGVVAFCLWFVLFVAGNFIATRPYREALSGEIGLGEALQALTVILFCYTATNAAMLCCIASVLGGVFRRMRERQRKRLLSPPLLVLVMSLVLQGFIVYLVMASGVVAFGGWEGFLDNPTREQYVRLAATCSLISFMIGFSPGLFNSLMGRLEKWAQGGVGGPEERRDPGEKRGRMTEREAEAIN